MGSWTPNAFALGCGDLSRAPKKRVLISWNGYPDDPTFGQSVAAMEKSLGSEISKHWVMLGKTAFGGPNGNGVDAVPPPPGLVPQQKLSADAKGWKQMAAQVREDILNSKVDPSEYEIVFLVTNHGADIKDARGNKSDYGLTTLGAEPPINTKMLAEFTKALPKGTRFKSVIASCYGADSQKALLQPLLDNQNCACGLTLAAPGLPAYSTKWNNRRGLPWEGRMAQLAASQKISMQGLLWTDLVDQKVGLLDFHRFPGGGRPDEDPSYSRSVSTSESRMLEVLKSRLKLSDDLESLEAKADDVLKRAQNMKPQFRASPVLKAATLERQSVVYSLLNLDPKDAESPEKLQALTHFEPKRIISYLPKTTLDAEGTKAKEEWYRIRREELWPTSDELEKVNKQLKTFSLSEKISFDNDEPSPHMKEYRELIRQQEVLAEKRKRASERMDANLETFMTKVDSFAIESNKAGYRDQRKRSAAAKILARGKLEQAFLAIASDQEFAEFERLRACENEPLVRNPQSASATSPKNAGDSNAH